MCCCFVKQKRAYLMRISVGSSDVCSSDLVVDGVHYRSGCDTRHGAYPYCDVLDIPSYSVAKSAVAALALMWMERLHPGVKDLPVGPFSHASGCMADKWKDTRFVDLLDMATGQYESPA